jgi:thioredoxin-like negative regulator of GroEL
MKQVIYFSAGWCTACQAMAPAIDQLKNSKGIPVTKIDTDYEASYVSEYNVKSVPTTIILENGQEVRRHSGTLSSQQLNNLING